MKVLIFATDVLPLKGVPTSGTALRTFGFKSGFEALGCETRVCVPKMAFESTWSKANSSVREELAQYEKFVFDHSNADDLIYDYEPDLVYCGHWPAACYRKFPTCPVVIDLAGPHLLERFYQGSGDHSGGIRAKLNALAGADYFIVSGRRQAEYFKSFLIRAGIEDVDRRIVLAPMALPPEVPKREFNSKKDLQFLFAGIFLPWQDPSVGLRAVVSEISEDKRTEDRSDRKTANLRLIGGTHPTYPVPTGVYEGLFKSIENNPRVSRSELVDLDILNQEMMKSDVAVDLMKRNFERELAVTIRTTTYLWSGLPVIYNDYSDLSELIERYNAGWLVDPSDEKAIREVVRSILENPSEVRKRSVNASNLAKNEFSWDKLVKNLLETINSKDILRKCCVINFARRERAAYHLGPNKEFKQSFLVEKTGLSKVELCLAAHGSVGEVELLLCEGTDERVIGTSKVSLNNSSEKQWHGIRVDPLRNSTANQYCLKIRSDNPKLGIWTCAVPDSPNYSLKSLSKSYGREALCFRAFCCSPLQ
jgi:glycosyltransferase involved in cell wall biosynthesis